MGITLNATTSIARRTRRIVAAPAALTRATPVTDHEGAVALRRAAGRAGLAPSVRDSAPWRFEITGRTLALYADRSRQLPALDPSGRQLIMSCGAALFNLRAALAAQGYLVDIDRRPEQSQPDRLAVLSISRAADGPVAALAAYDLIAELCQVNRRRFSDDGVPTVVVAALSRAATANQCQLQVVAAAPDRLTIAQLCERADEIENLNPAYRRDIRQWASTQAPVDDYGSHGEAWRPSVNSSAKGESIMVLTSVGDLAPDWLAAGEALQQMMLELTRHGFVASLQREVIEVVATRESLRESLGICGYPHVVVRVGRAPLGSTVPRRHRSDRAVAG